MELPPNRIDNWTLAKIESNSKSVRLLCYSLTHLKYMYQCCITHHIPSNTISNYWTHKESHYYRIYPFQYKYRTPRPYTYSTLSTILNQISQQIFLQSL